MKKSGQLVRVAFGKEVHTTCKIGTLTRTLTLYHHFLQHSQNFGRLGIPNRRIDTHLVDDISEEGIYHSWVKIRTYVKMSWNSDGNHLKSDLRVRSEGWNEPEKISQHPLFTMQNRNFNC